jgi:isochorismate pyruvate lyase
VRPDAAQSFQGGIENAKSMIMTASAQLQPAFTGPPAPLECQTMADVRAGVDALDEQIVLLLAERQRYMDAAARIKTNRTAVRDEARIEDVIAKVKRAATKAGLSHAIAEPVWRQLVDRCIAYEYGRWDDERKG